MNNSQIDELIEVLDTAERIPQEYSSVDFGNIEDLKEKVVRDYTPDEAVRRSWTDSISSGITVSVGVLLAVVFLLILILPKKILTYIAPYATVIILIVILVKELSKKGNNNKK